MDKLVWNERLDVSNETVNEHHRKLVSIVNRFVEMESGDGEKLSEILSELMEYSFYHFDFEEALMEEQGYSDLENHKKEHLFFTEYVARMCVKVMEKGPDIHNDINRFLKSWLVNHIVKTDKESFPEV